jgi:site-specific DNA-methyltransferase (adenine-specific)
MRSEVITGDCLKIMPELIERGLVFDACITDPPYGTTACAWDSVIEFAPMWANLKQLVKKNGAIVLFGSQPFTSALVMSNPLMFKYEWVWQKEQGVNFQLASYQPLKIHENVLVFSSDVAPYFPQGLIPCSIQKTNWGKARRLAHLGSEKKRARYIQEFTNHPTTLLRYDRERGLHPTQKPVELMRYLVRTYSNEGDTILDFTCGSGSTGVACMIENRNFIGIEQDNHYAEIARARISRAQGHWAEIPKRVSDRELPLFNERVA